MVHVRDKLNQTWPFPNDQHHVSAYSKEHGEDSIPLRSICSWSCDSQEMPSWHIEHGKSLQEKTQKIVAPWPAIWVLVAQKAESSGFRAFKTEKMLPALTILTSNISLAKYRWTTVSTGCEHVPCLPQCVDALGWAPKTQLHLPLVEESSSMGSEWVWLMDVSGS